MERGCRAEKGRPGRAAEIYSRPKPIRWRGSISGLASMMVLGWSAACEGEAPAAQGSGTEEPQQQEHATISVEGQRVASRRIEIRMGDDMRFEPENPVVAVGDTIVWINVGAMPHTATDTPGRAGVPEHNILPEGAAPWDSGLIEGQGHFRVVFQQPGDYTYLCTLHEVLGMVGRVTVK